MKLGRVRGVTILINNWFLALLGVYFAAGVLERGLIAFGVVLIHELAHIWAARRLGISVGQIEILPFGGVAEMGSELVLQPAKEIMVALAGPVANLALCMFAFGLLHYGVWHAALTPFFIQCNLLLFAFNLLPGLPLDGGRIWRAFLASRVGLTESTLYAATWGQFWGILITLAGAVGVYTHVAGLDIVATGLFLFYAATRERKQAPYLYARYLLAKQQTLATTGVLSGELLVAAAWVPVWRVTRLFVPQRYHFVAVVDKQGRLIRLVEEAVLVRAIMAGNAGTPLGETTENLPEINLD
ncbi:MAG: Peptidase M50 [Clostridia bacterium 62_21]|nr:MAG: Peptidase M50 [Clostridia bacterium 62_21]